MFEKSEFRLGTKVVLESNHLVEDASEVEPKAMFNGVVLYGNTGRD